MDTLSQRLSGTGVALVTPFDQGKIDWIALGRIIEYVIASGVDFLVSLGTTGETSTLSETEQRAILDFTIQKNRGRLPLVAGVFGDNNTAALVEKVKNFNFEGIDALLSSNPAYNKPTQAGIFQHYMALAEASPRPIIIYNVPSRSATNMSAETSLCLAHSSAKFVGIKEASNDLMQIMQIIKGKPEHFLVLSGDDGLTLPVVACGGDGVISVLANALPMQISKMVRAALRHDWKAAQSINLALLDFYALIFLEGNPAGIKAALECKHLCNRSVRLPLVQMSDEGKSMIGNALVSIDAQ